MQTSISLPDEVFQQAEEAATALRLTRDEFYTLALQRELRRQAEEAVTARLNMVYQDEAGEIDPALAMLQATAPPQRALVMERGEVWWAELPEPVGSEPGYRRPLIVAQADSFNRSRIRTVIGVVVTKNLDLARAPGNVLLTASDSGLPLDSVVNVSQVLTVDKRLLTGRVWRVPEGVMAQVEAGLRLVLGL